MNHPIALIYLSIKAIGVNRISLLLIFLLIHNGIIAQPTGPAAKEAVKDTLVAKFNRGDLDGIYEMGGNVFKTFQTRDDFITFFNQVKEAGKILSVELIEEQGFMGYYKLHFAKLDLMLALRVLNAKTFFDLGLTDYQFANADSLRAKLRDNPLQDGLDTAIDRAVTRYLADPRTAGLSIGLIRNGREYFYNYGEMEKGLGQRPTKNTIYEIGSITKTFTGLLLAEMVHEKKIALDDDIRKYMDGYFDNLEFNNQPIRILNLCNHSSGIPGKPANLEDQNPYDSLNPFANYTLAMLWDALHALRMDELPGTRHAYSNTALALLGHILEHIYFARYTQLIKSFITDPLKMGSTRVAYSVEDSIYFARGYDENGNPAANWDWGAFIPAAGLRSTASDMVKYILANITEKSPAMKLSHKLTTGTATDGIGLSWVLSKTPDGHSILSHVGSTAGFSSSCLIIPDLKSGFIILANSGAYMNELTDRLTYIIMTMGGK